ncbi:MAG: SpoIIE family protein phosphatase [Brevinematales bacterium]|jgi:sigma-B regulation protein RsbU (phosphoserine phosphatase)
MDDRSILLVDDSPVIRSMIEKILREEGYRNIDMASDGLDAKGILSRKSYRMVISDYEMPNMDGGELLNFIKSAYPDILVIMLSGQEQRQTVVKLMRNADNYIVKDRIDIIKADIVKAVSQAFERQKLLKENKELLEKLTERDNMIRKELNHALYLLRSIYEVEIPGSPAFDIRVFNRLSNTIGGDYYIVKRLNNKIGIMLADISGHGIPAAMLVFALRDVVENIISECPQTSIVIDLLDSRLKKVFPESIFATVSYITLDDDSREIVYTNEFQNPILYQNDKGELKELNNGKVKLLGLYDREDFKGKLDFNFAEDTVKLNKGERLFMFTDGITEAKNSGHEEFGMERLADSIRRNTLCSLEECLQNIFNEVREFNSGDLADDITIIGIEMK